MRHFDIYNRPVFTYSFPGEVVLPGGENKTSCKSGFLQDATFDYRLICGERGIRTPGPRERTTVFKTAAFDHSAISPWAQK